MVKAFSAYLKEQLGFITASCAACDAGHTAEGVRIGTSLRVLFHQTPKSTSLLTHMGATGISLLSTTHGLPPDMPTPLAFDGMFRHSTTGGLQPKLGSGSYKGFLPMTEWWTQVVIVIKGAKLSRRDLALTAANKDGGAHIDVALPAGYKALVEGFWSNAAGKISDHHALCLRQLGYEVLNSPDLISLAT